MRSRPESLGATFSLFRCQGAQARSPRLMATAWARLLSKRNATNPPDPSPSQSIPVKVCGHASDLHSKSWGPSQVKVRQFRVHALAPSSKAFPGSEPQVSGVERHVCRACTERGQHLPSRPTVADGFVDTCVARAQTASMGCILMAIPAFGEEAQEADRG